VSRITCPSRSRSPTRADGFPAANGPTRGRPRRRTTTHGARPSAPFTSKYDYFLAGQAALSDQELRGLERFEAEDRGNRAACHPSQPGGDGSAPLFTDFTYDNLGVPPNPDNPFLRLPSELYSEGEAFVDLGLGGALDDPAEDGKFKVGSLRNIAITPP